MYFRPTQALVRAAVAAAVAGALAVMTAQPALLVLAAPFVAASVVGALHRPRAHESTPQSAVSSRRVRLGESVEVSVDAGSADMIICATLPRPADAEMSPRWGAVCALESAALELRPRRWGRLDLPSVSVQVWDSWGMWTADAVAATATITVSPTPDSRGGGDALPHPIGVAGIHRSERRGDGSALAEIRPFRAGDRLNRINWRVTSRTGDLHTNATNADRDTEVVIVIDTLSDITTAELSGTVEFASSLDATAIAAASLSEHYLRLGDRVGIRDLGRVIGDIPARTGPRQTAVIAESLARARTEPARGERMRGLSMVRPGTFAVVCSPLLDRDVLDEIVRLRHRGTAVLVVDTLPQRLGALPAGEAGWARAKHVLGSGRDTTYWEEAWVLRRLEREEEIDRIRALGIPVAPWQGIEGIGMLAATLAAGRGAARLTRTMPSGGGS